MEKRIKPSDLKNYGIIVVIILAVLCLLVQLFAPEKDAVIIASMSLCISSASVFFILFPLLQSAESERVRNIEVKLEKFYIPLFNLLTTQNEINQDKINEINCYIHLADPCTRSYFLEYYQKKGSDDELLDRIKIDIGLLQKNYIELIDDIST